MSWYLNSISFKGMELITRTAGGEMLVISMSTLRWWSRYLTYGRYGGTQPNPLRSDLLHQLLWQLLSASLWREMGITLGSTTAAALNAQKTQHHLLTDVCVMPQCSTGLLLCHKLCLKCLVCKKVSCYCDRSVLFYEPTNCIACVL